MSHDSPRHVLVTGLVRNGERQLPQELARWREALQGIPSVQWLLIESDSTDGTPALLQRLEAEVPGMRCLSLGALRRELPQRTQRMAFCRNRFLDELAQHAGYHEVDHVIVTDLDDVNTHLTAEGLRSCWSRGDWDACMANQHGPYYDIWALRHRLWSPNDWYAAQEFLRQHGVSDERALRAALHSRMITIAPDSDWIEVDSAFGGLAIYKRAALEGVRYVGLNARGAEVCEHVTLHQQMRERGRRLFINPRLINTDGNEHSAAMRWPQTALRMLRRPVQRAYDRLRGRQRPLPSDLA